MSLKKEMLTKTFLRVKPVKMLCSLKSGPKYATILSKENNCTYSHTVKLLDLFKDFGFVEFEKKGRIKIISLTESGENISILLKKILIELNTSNKK